MLLRQLLRLGEQLQQRGEISEGGMQDIRKLLLKAVEQIRDQPAKDLPDEEYQKYYRNVVDQLDFAAGNILGGNFDAAWYNLHEVAEFAIPIWDDFHRRTLSR
ncbi:MAG: hypothetical protein QMD46_05525 [Methanomicrobiales archaeon]|nr:hypothetical protein [Methanomicrobiales archaeon]